MSFTATDWTLQAESQVLIFFQSTGESSNQTNLSKTLLACCASTRLRSIVLGFLTACEKSFNIKTKLICNMPSDGLSFAVLIGCDPGLIYLFWDCFKFRKHSLFVWRNHVFWAKIILNINSQAFCWEINGMTIRSLDFEISSEKFFNGLWLCWRLHNDKVFWHNDRF